MRERERERERGEGGGGVGGQGERRGEKERERERKRESEREKERQKERVFFCLERERRRRGVKDRNCKNLWVVDHGRGTCVWHHLLPTPLSSTCCTQYLTTNLAYARGQSQEYRYRRSKAQHIVDSSGVLL